MTENHSYNDKPKFTLKGEMQKRRTQEILRTIEDKRSDPARTTQTTPAVSMPIVSEPTLTLLTPTAPSVSQTSISAVKPAQPMSWDSRVVVIASLLTAAVVVIGLIALRSRISSNPVVTNTTASAVVSPSQLTDHFKQSSVQVNAVRNIPVSSNAWHASQIIAFDAQENGSQGSFIFVGFSPTNQGIPDILKIAGDRLKGWQAISATSAILLIAPGTNQTLATDVSRQLGQFLVTPRTAQSETIS